MTLMFQGAGKKRWKFRLAPLDFFLGQEQLLTSCIFEKPLPSGGVIVKVALRRQFTSENSGKKIKEKLEVAVQNRRKKLFENGLLQRWKWVDPLPSLLWTGTDNGQKLGGYVFLRCIEKIADTDRAAM